LPKIGKIANRINRLIQRERQQISPKIKRLTFLDSKAIKMDRIPKGLPQGRKKKAIQINRTKPI